MSDAMVERRPTTRFFCHRCNIEFDDILQEYTCPYCAGGFIEQLENETDRQTHSGDDFSDADMSNIDDNMSSLDDSDDIHQTIHGAPPLLNDLAFLMSGGRSRSGAGRRETLMEQLVWMIGGGRAGAGAGAGAAAGALPAGAPLLLVGSPGDYVFGGEGLDAVVTQLLGQLENAGPPPLSREALAELPREPAPAQLAAANTACSICWDNLQIGEMVSRLECEHVFHSACITPWLQLHATCPVCRRSLLPYDALPVPLPTAHPASLSAAPRPAPDAHDAHDTHDTHTPDVSIPDTTRTADSENPPAPAPPVSRATPVTLATARYTTSFPRLVVRRRRPAPGDSSSSGSSASLTAGGASTTPTTSTPTSSTSLNSSDREQHYNMDIDFD